MTTKHTSLEDKAHHTTRMGTSVALGITLAAASAFTACAPQPECFEYQKREVCRETVADTSRGAGHYHGGTFFYGSGGQRVYVPQSEMPAVQRAYQSARSSGRVSTGSGFRGGTTVRGGFGGTGRGFGGGFG
jgi:hypothetical protein